MSINFEKQITDFIKRHKGLASLIKGLEKVHSEHLQKHWEK